MPKPTMVFGPAAFVSIAVTVPFVEAPNCRDTAPPGVSRLAKIEVVGPVGVVGVVVGVVLSPHAAAAASAAASAVVRTSDRIANRLFVTDVRPESCNRPRR
jgi:hypothetical protein